MFGIRQHLLLREILAVMFVGIVPVLLLALIRTIPEHFTPAASLYNGSIIWLLPTKYFTVYALCHLEFFLSENDVNRIKATDSETPLKMDTST